MRLLSKIQCYVLEVTIAKPSSRGSLKQAQQASLVALEQGLVAGASGEETVTAWELEVIRNSSRGDTGTREASAILEAELTVH